MHEALPPSIVNYSALRPVIADEVSRAFPVLNEARPGDMIGVYLELIHLNEMTPSLSGWFIQAGRDLRTWSDLNLIDVASIDTECVSRAQLAIHSKLREMDFNQIQHLDPTWGRVSFDGIPTRALTIVPHAQMLTVTVDQAEYDTVEDIGHMNHLFLPPVESAHARLKAMASRAAAFSLFSQLSQLDEWMGVPAVYAVPQDAGL